MVILKNKMWILAESSFDPLYKGFSFIFFSLVLYLSEINFSNCFFMCRNNFSEPVDLQL
jgi:hypothetical protein